MRNKPVRFTQTEIDYIKTIVQGEPYKSAIDAVVRDGNGDKLLLLGSRIASAIAPYYNDWAKHNGYIERIPPAIARYLDPRITEARLAKRRRGYKIEYKKRAKAAAKLKADRKRELNKQRPVVENAWQTTAMGDLVAGLQQRAHKAATAPPAPPPQAQATLLAGAVSLLEAALQQLELLKRM